MRSHRILKWSTLCVFLVSPAAWAFGRFTIGPYASISSSKSIKPNKTKTANDEQITQVTTYGVLVDVRLMRLLSLGINVGQNQTDTTKKSSAMVDNFGSIDFAKDANVDQSQPDNLYTYKEVQRLGVAKLIFQPTFFNVVYIRATGGVRARQRLIDITDKVTNTKSSIKDPIRYQALAGAGLGLRFLRAFNAQMEYTFYFRKFPKTQPFEQEVAVSFGASI